MKKILSALLAALVVLTLCAVPASAVSSGGLQTYYYISNERYGKRNGLKYDIVVTEIPVNGYNIADPSEAKRKPVAASFYTPHSMPRLRAAPPSAFLPGKILLALF